MNSKTVNTAKVLGKTLTGVGTHGKHRGRPMLFTRDAVRGLVREAREKNVSLRALCAEKGLAYISVNVAKARYGLTKTRTANA